MHPSEPLPAPGCVRPPSGTDEQLGASRSATDCVPAPPAVLIRRYGCTGGRTMHILQPCDSVVICRHVTHSVTRRPAHRSPLTPLGSGRRPAPQAGLMVLLQIRTLGSKQGAGTQLETVRYMQKAVKRDESCDRE